MPEDRNGDSSDHGRLNKARWDIENLIKRVESLEADRKILVSDRAKFIGYAMGAAAAASLLMKYGLPK